MRTDCRTDCPISQGGFCERHGVHKSAAWVRLCVRKPAYWRAWEQGRGPGQKSSQTRPPEKPRPDESKPCGGCGKKSMPPLVKQAVGLAKAGVDFVADGFRIVSDGEYERRLAICETCELRSGKRCSKCGCFIAVKAKGRAWRCPDGRWDLPVQENGTIAAIVPYYNFARSNSRAKNYHECFKHLKSQGFAVYTAEAALEGHPFDTPEGPRTKHYTVHDPLFCKETLFNLTLKGLPREYTSVCWIDADVTFSRSDMAAATIEALRQWPVVQMFQDAVWTDRTRRKRIHHYSGIAYKNIASKTKSASPDGQWPGLAWAARRETLDALGGLYDGYPAGSGDVFAVAGFYGDSGLKYFAKYHPIMLGHFWENWGNNTKSIIAGNVGYVEATLTHLWHGEIENRHYWGRHQALNDAAFDPAIHQVRDANGIYRFSEDCPQLAKEWLYKYMLEMRREDG